MNSQNTPLRAAGVRRPIHDLLRRRRSGVAFVDRRVEPEVLASLFEAARWAPSSYNEQPWSFMVASRDNAADYVRLLGCLAETNQRWAQQAPVLVLTVAKLNFTHNGSPNRHAFHDVGLAVANVVFEATSRGLVVHQMAGFDAARAREVFGIPAGYEPVSVIALGYPGRPEHLPEDLRARETASRTRKPAHEFVFCGRWGRPSPLTAEDNPGL